LRTIGFVMPLSLPLDAEEHETVPPRPGDRAGDCGQRPVRPALPLVPVGQHRDRMLDAAVFTDQPRADDRLRVVPDAPGSDVVTVVLLAEDLQPPDRLGLQAAVGQLLDAVGEPVLEGAPVVLRRLGLEQLPPLRLQVGHRHGLERGEARGDRVGHAGLRRVGFA
jgi:hypothetical protein